MDASKPKNDRKIVSYWVGGLPPTLYSFCTKGHPDPVITQDIHSMTISGTKFVYPDKISSFLSATWLRMHHFCKICLRMHHLVARWPRMHCSQFTILCLQFTIYTYSHGFGTFSSANLTQYYTVHIVYTIHIPMDLAHFHMQI